MKNKTDTLKAIGSFLSGLGFVITAIFGIVKWKYERQQRAKVAGRLVYPDDDMHWDWPDEEEHYY